MLIVSGKVTSKRGKEPHFIRTRELEKDAAREKWKNLIAQGWKEPRKIEKKRELRQQILNNMSKILNY